MFPMRFPKLRTGPMANTKLTDEDTKRAPPPGKTEMFIWDSAIPGFALRLRTGVKPVWLFKFRYGKRQRSLTIGNTSAMKATAARAAASGLYARLKAGEDPAATKARAVTAQGETFGATVDAYTARKAESLRPRSYIELERHLRVHAKPLHRLPLTEIRRRDVTDLVSALAKTSGPTAANHVGAATDAMLSWARREGWVETNVASGLNKFSEKPRERVLSGDELIRIWKATDDRAQYSAIVRLLMLTGCRREEIGGLSWGEIDFDKALITLPPARTKSARTLDLPLSPMAVEILKAQPRREGRDFVFGETARRGFLGWAQGKIALDARVKPAEPFVLHDLRRTMSTAMNGELGIAPHVVEACLGHVGQSSIARVYNKSTYAAEKRAAFLLWGEYIEALVDGRESKVVALRR
jgi:integrase